MKYTCNNEFMIRMPALPTEVAKELYDLNFDEVWTYVEKNDLENYIKEALQISSQSLYDAVCRLDNGSPKDKATYNSLYKYLIRAATRTTPYGILANVSMGKFDDTNTYIKLQKGFKKCICADNLWIYRLIENLEHRQDVLNQIGIIWNKSCFITDNRMRNPNYSKHGTLETVLKESSSIRYNNLIKLIKENTQQYIKYSNLCDILVKEYPKVGEMKIKNTLNMLIDQEYLFTELRIPAYCKDTIDYITKVLEKNCILNSLQENLRNLQHYFKQYDLGENVLGDIIELMQNIQESSSYVEVNSGSNLKEIKLNNEVKSKLEKFTECIARIGMESEVYTILDLFKENFQEEFGQGVEVPLAQVINPSGFDGLSYISDEKYNPTEREILINNIFINKIEEAILNGERKVNLTSSDFKNIPFSYYKTISDSIDINILLTRSFNELKCYLGPNIGADSAGKSFQRFENIFEDKPFEQYNKIYKEKINDKIIYAELREMPIAGRLSNVMNWKSNYPYQVLLSLPEGNNSETNILVEDLAIGMDDENKLYLKSISKGKYCRLFTDNMLNHQLNSKLFNLLYAISREYEDIRIIERLSGLTEYKSLYSPEIEIEGIIVAPEKWRISQIYFQKLDFGEFKKKYDYLKKRFQLPEYFYLCRGDNRLLLKRDDGKTAEILYQEIDHQSDIELCAVEKNFFSNEMVQDHLGNHFMVECIFSLYNSEKFTKKRSNQKNAMIQNAERLVPPFHNGWVYLKIYCNREMEDDFLIRFKKDKSKLLVNRFFFLRYFDDTGMHIRLRIKYDNEEDALSKYSLLNQWLSEMREDSFIKRWSINEYYRENNRYGGSSCITMMEDFFCSDSEYVIDLISSRKSDDSHELIDTYIEAIAGELCSLTQNIEEMFRILDNLVDKESYRKEYRKNRQHYIGIIKSAIEQDVGLNIKKVLHANPLDLSSTPDEIISSMLHMRCNRLNRNRELEIRTYSLIRHTMYDEIKKIKYYKK